MTIQTTIYVILKSYNVTKGYLQDVKTFKDMKQFRKDENDQSPKTGLLRESMNALL